MKSLLFRVIGILSSLELLLSISLATGLKRNPGFIKEGFPICFKTIMPD